MPNINGVSNIDYKSTGTVNSVNKTTGDSSFSSYLGETKSLDEIFDKAAEEYNVPVNLLKAIGKAESNFNATAVSRCGAQGIMQLMPATAAGLGVTDSLDAEQNIMGGAKYISQLLKKYDGNTSLALAAYNAGSGNVAKYGGIPPFEETQNYVKKVTNYMNQDIETGSTVTVKGNQTTKTAPVNYLSSNYEIIDKDNTDAMLQELDSLFSYEDYLNFLGKFMEDNRSTTEDETSFYASKSIQYNLPVMNLLNKIY